jgi:Tfp pilus assembly protein PilF/mono/diheme cytochrome c family protein
MISRRTAVIGFMAGVLLASRSRAAQPQLPASPVQRVTFSADIAPILFRNCASCHHAGEAGPFPLVSYGDAKKHARQIAEVTRLRIMPPWLPEPGEAKFTDEQRLSTEQIASIGNWVEQGALEGNPADLPTLPKFVAGWQLGTPDLIISAKKPFRLPASGGDRYWNFVLPVPIDQTRWLKAIEIRPGNKRLVHHANILVDRAQSARHRHKDALAGFGGMDLGIESEFFDPDSHFLFWKPGTVPYVEPEGMSLRLDKGADLILNIHVQPSGKPELITPSVGLYFTNKPATLHPMLLQIENDAKLDIPPGEENFIVTDSLTLPVDVDVLAIYPHCHYLGKNIQGSATLPDGSTRSLIHIPRWDLNWQAVYRYQEPIFLPKGTTVTMRYTYDNSAGNVANPNHPPQRVTAGNRARDEMAHLWLQVLPRSVNMGDGDPRMALQEAVAKHKVEKDPLDFESHYNFAAMLQSRGKLEAALAQYEAALAIRPGDAVANNALGGALLAANRVDRAVNHLKAALQNRPDYFDAHYNLGSALAAEGDFAAAAEQFRSAVRLNPEDADAEANLGSALAQIGQLTEAIAHFEKALKLNPEHELARENLKQVRNMAH